MKSIKKTALSIVLGTTCTTLPTYAAYISFKGLAASLPLDTPDELSNFYNGSTDLKSCFKTGSVPPLVDQYYKFESFLKTYNTAEFLHIHPEWVLVSNFVLHEKNIQVGHTYQTNSSDSASPKFKVIQIQNYPSDSASSQFSLIKINEGDKLGLAQEPANLVDQSPMMLFLGDTSNIEKAEEICTGLDKIVSDIQDIENGNLANHSDLQLFVTNLKDVISSAAEYSTLSNALKLISKLGPELIKLKPELDKICAKIIDLRPTLAAEIILGEVDLGINNNFTFIASPYSHALDNTLIYNHQYTPVLSRVGGGPNILRDIKEGFEDFMHINNPGSLTLHTYHKSHSLFNYETYDTVPFDFVTMKEDTGLPVFIYDTSTNKYSLLSLCQIPNKEQFDIPILTLPSVLQWMITTTQDDYFQNNYSSLVNIGKLNINATPSIAPVPEDHVTPSITPVPEDYPTPSVTPIPAKTTTPTVEPAPAEITTPTVEPAPPETTTPTVEPAPAETTTPTVEPAPAKTTTPSVEPLPAETTTPTVEPAPAEATTTNVEPVPAETTTPEVVPVPSNASN